MIESYAFTKIMVADLAAMERFYCGALGLTVQARISEDRPGHAMHETVLVVGKGGGTLLNLVQLLDKPCAPPGEAVVGLTVTDIDALISATVDAGGTLVTPVTEVPAHNLKVAYVSDPEGHMLELLQSTG
jgi:predicted enzyme related to lactoylglutathione lyase